MEIDKALKIALEVANEPRPAISPKQDPTAEVADSAVDTASPGMALAAEDVVEAIRLIQEIALGRDPFTSDPLSTHRPEQNPATTKALCTVIAAISEQLGLNKTVAVAPMVSEERGIMPLEEYILKIERREIMRAMEAVRYNKTEAARLLGITFRALRYKLEQQGIE